MYFRFLPTFANHVTAILNFLNNFSGVVDILSPRQSKLELSIEQTELLLFHYHKLRKKPYNFFNVSLLLFEVEKNYSKTRANFLNGIGHILFILYFVIFSLFSSSTYLHKTAAR